MLDIILYSACYIYVTIRVRRSVVQTLVSHPQWPRAMRHTFESEGKETTPFRHMIRTTPGEMTYPASFSVTIVSWKQKLQKWSWTSAPWVPPTALTLTNPSTPSCSTTSLLKTFRMNTVKGIELYVLWKPWISTVEHHYNAVCSSTCFEVIEYVLWCNISICYALTLDTFDSKCRKL